MVTANQQAVARTPAKRNSTRSRKSSRADSEKLKEPLTQAEASKLIDSMESLEDRILLLIGFSAGMRATEVCSLEPINFEFSSGTVKIWDRRRRRYRSVFLSDETMGEIRSFIASRRDAKVPRLFPFSSRVIETKVQKRTAEVLGKARSWESIRRTYVATSARLDMPIRIVVENTGELPANVLKYYMSEAFSSPRRKVNDISLYPDSPRQMVKSDDLKVALEKPYVEKAEKIITERNRLRDFAKGMGI